MVTASPAGACESRARARAPSAAASAALSLSLIAPLRTAAAASGTSASGIAAAPLRVPRPLAWAHPRCRGCRGRVPGRLTLEGALLCWRCFDDAYRELGVAG